MGSSKTSAQNFPVVGREQRLKHGESLMHEDRSKIRMYFGATSLCQSDQPHTTLCLGKVCEEFVSFAVF